MNSVKKICHILNIKKALAYQPLHYHHPYGVTHNVNAQQLVITTPLWAQISYCMLLNQ
jgi:hypothetical protein